MPENVDLNDNDLIQLLKKLDELKEDYHSLTKTRNQPQTQALAAMLTQVMTMDNSSEDRKFLLIVAKLEVMLNKEIQHFSKPFLSLGKPKPPQAFIEKLNNKNERGDIFSKLLITLLQCLYNDYPHLKERDNLIVSLDMIKLPNHPVFLNKIPTLLNEEYQSYRYFEDRLKQVGVNAAQAYSLYKGQEQLDVTLAKKLWPELRQYRLSDESIEKLLDGSIEANSLVPTERELNDIANAAEMLLRLSEFSGVSNRVTPADRKQQAEALKEKFNIRNVSHHLHVLKEVMALIRDKQTEYTFTPLHAKAKTK